MGKVRYTKKHTEPGFTPFLDFPQQQGATEYRAWTTHGADDPSRKVEQDYSTLTVWHFSPHLHSSPKGTEWNAKREAEGKHPRLFFEQPSKLSGLYASEGMNHTVPTLLGLAVNDNRGNLTHDDDLSENSAPLVKKGIASGAITPNAKNPDAIPTNSLSVMKGRTYSEVPSGKHAPIPEGRVQEARDTVRQVLRPKKASASAPTHLSSQFQPHLPGFED